LGNTLDSKFFESFGHGKDSGKG